MSFLRNFFVALVFALSSISAQATVELFQWGVNTDNAWEESLPYPVFWGDPLPVGMTGSFDASGFGSLSTSITGIGSHNIDLWLDYEITESGNSFYNETGMSGGTLSAGQSWEIDEPGYPAVPFPGDIYDNVKGSALDMSSFNGLDIADDVSFALGWDFDLALGETATINFFMSDVLDTSGFYLLHEDSLSSDQIYFWSTLTIDDGTVSVPEPNVIALMGLGLIGMGFARRRKI